MSSSTYYKYIAISKLFGINLLNVLLESVNERYLFVFEKAMQFNFFNEQVITDTDIQECFVEAIKDRLSNKDKYYIAEKFKNNAKFAEWIRIGIERRDKNEINEESAIEYLIEKIKSYVVLKNIHGIWGQVVTADSNLKDGMINEKDLEQIKGSLYHLLNELTFDADFGEMELDDTLKRERDRTSINLDKIVPTFSDKLNEIMNGGGMPGKLYFIAAPPGFGKSLFLMNVGKKALEHDKTVYHFSLEMSTSEVMGRYDCLISGKPMIDILNSPAEVIKGYIDDFMSRNKGYLLIKEFPPETLTKEMISMYLRRKIMTTGKKPDLIIVDYADLMKSNNKNLERTRDLGLIYRQLKALAAEFDCPVWTASQINRQGFSAKESDISNLSESWEKAMIADLVLVVRQTKEEFDSQRLRLYVGKNRSGAARQEIPCEVNYQYMKMTELHDTGVERMDEIDFMGGPKRTVDLTKREETDPLFG